MNPDINTLSPQQIKIQALIKSFEDAVVQPEELMLAMDAVLDLINSAEERLNKAISRTTDTSTAETTRIAKDFGRAREEINSLIDELRGATSNELSAIRDQLRSEIANVATRIPASYDDRSVWEHLAEIEAKIPTLPEAQTGEDYRNALEALPDGDKLKIEAIEDLRKELDELKKKMVKMGGGGGTQGGITAAHAPIHETFTMDGVATTVTLSQGVGAQGTAIFALRYQGQVLDMTTHYTVNGNRITFVGFTPESSTIISITYLS